MKQDELLQRKNKTLHIIAYLADQVRQIDSELNNGSNNKNNGTHHKNNGVEYNSKEYKS